MLRRSLMAAAVANRIEKNPSTCAFRVYVSWMYILRYVCIDYKFRSSTTFTSLQSSAVNECKLKIGASLAPDVKSMHARNEYAPFKFSAFVSME